MSYMLLAEHVVTQELSSDCTYTVDGPTPLMPIVVIGGNSLLGHSYYFPVNTLLY